MADQTAITAAVTGRVQGVGNRDTVVRVAREFGLVGWARNAPDGPVETWAQGSDPVLEQFVAFLKQGPRSVVVRSVPVRSVDPDSSLQGFAVRS